MAPSLHASQLELAYLICSSCAVLFCAPLSASLAGSWIFLVILAALLQPQAWTTSGWCIQTSASCYIPRRCQSPGITLGLLSIPTLMAGMYTASPYPELWQHWLRASLASALSLAALMYWLSSSSSSSSSSDGSSSSGGGGDPYPSPTSSLGTAAAAGDPNGGSSICTNGSSRAESKPTAAAACGSPGPRACSGACLHAQPEACQISSKQQQQQQPATAAGQQQRPCTVNFCTSASAAAVAAAAVSLASPSAAPLDACSAAAAAAAAAPLFHLLMSQLPLSFTLGEGLVVSQALALLLAAALREFATHGLAVALPQLLATFPAAPHWQLAPGITLPAPPLGHTQPQGPATGEGGSLDASAFVVRLCFWALVFAACSGALVRRLTATRQQPASNKTAPRQQRDRNQTAHTAQDTDLDPSPTQAPVLLSPAGALLSAVAGAVTVLGVAASAAALLDLAAWVLLTFLPASAAARLAALGYWAVLLAASLPLMYSALHTIPGTQPTTPSHPHTRTEPTADPPSSSPASTPPSPPSCLATPAPPRVPLSLPLPAVPHILLRKGYHVIALLLFVPVLALDPEMLQVSLSIAFALLLAVEVLRNCSCGALAPLSAPLTRFMAGFVDERDAGLLYLSHLALLLGMAGPLWMTHACCSAPAPAPAEDVQLPCSVCWPWVLVAGGGMVCLGLGDTAASVAGVRWGRVRLFAASRKTLEGTAAGAAAMLLACVALRWAAPPAATLADGAWARGGAAVVLATVGAAALEASTHQLDNLVVPIYYTAALLLGVAC